MHPHDVAAEVGRAVADLERQLEAQPDLHVTAVDLDDDLFVKITFEQLPIYKTELSPVAPQLFLPNGQLGQRLAAVPMLGTATPARPLVLGLELDGWDSQPPTANLFLPDGTPLPRADWPKSFDGQGIVDGHRLFDRPFFCRPGTREFHTHHQHGDEPWDRYRETLALHQIVIQILEDLDTRFRAAA